MSNNAKALIIMFVIVILWAFFSHNVSKQSGEKCSVPIILKPQKTNKQDIRKQNQKQSLETPGKVNDKKL